MANGILTAENAKNAENNEADGAEIKIKIRSRSRSAGMSASRSGEAGWVEGRVEGRVVGAGAEGGGVGGDEGELAKAAALGGVEGEEIDGGGAAEFVDEEVVAAEGTFVDGLGVELFEGDG
jgi:hypothetical protein